MNAVRPEEGPVVEGSADLGDYPDLARGKDKVADLNADGSASDTPENRRHPDMNAEFSSRTDPRSMLKFHPP